MNGCRISTNIYLRPTLLLQSNPSDGSKFRALMAHGLGRRRTGRWGVAEAGEQLAEAGEPSGLLLHVLKIGGDLGCGAFRH